MRDHTTNLVKQFASMRPYLPKGKFSRWADIRFLFGTSAGIHWPSKRAIWEMNDYGEKTRTRWQTEYRHQRTLAAITAGEDIQPKLTV